MFIFKTFFFVIHTKVIQSIVNRGRGHLRKGHLARDHSPLLLVEKRLIYTTGDVSVKNICHMFKVEKNGTKSPQISFSPA